MYIPSYVVPNKMGAVQSSFKFTYGVVCGLSKFTALTALAIGAVAVMTKPSQESFDKYFRSYIQSQYKSPRSSIESVIHKAAAYLSNKAASPEFEDYVFGLIATVGENDQQVFLGIFNGWYKIE